MKLWYEKKRDEFYRAYNEAIDAEDMTLANEMFIEYENYVKLCGGVR